MKEGLDEIRERFADFYLSYEEKRDIVEALELSKKGGLLTKKDVFGCDPLAHAGTEFLQCRRTRSVLLASKDSQWVPFRAKPKVVKDI